MYSWTCGDLSVAHGEHADAVVLVGLSAAVAGAARPFHGDLLAFGDDAGDLEADRAGLVVAHRGGQELAQDRLAAPPGSRDRQFPVQLPDGVRREAVADRLQRRRPERRRRSAAEPSCYRLMRACRPSCCRWLGWRAVGESSARRCHGSVALAGRRWCRRFSPSRRRRRARGAGGRSRRAARGSAGRGRCRPRRPRSRSGGSSRRSARSRQRSPASPVRDWPVRTRSALRAPRRRPKARGRESPPTDSSTTSNGPRASPRSRTAAIAPSASNRSARREDPVTTVTAAPAAAASSVT